MKIYVLRSLKFSLTYFLPLVSFYTSITTENPGFSDVFRGIQKLVAWNGLIGLVVS